MEGKLIERLKEEIQETNNLAEDLLLIENSKQDESEEEIKKKSAKELEAEEEKLKFHLCELKKENFALQTTISAWQKTLKNKLEEFKEAGSKLDEIYNEIWLEREAFCSEADKFNEDYGIFSEWWKTQMNFLSDLEDLEKKKSEDQKCKQEIEKLEKEIQEIKKEIEVLQTGKQIAEVEVHSTEDGNFAFARGKNTMREISPQKLNETEKTQETNNQMKNCEEVDIERNELYSMVDVEKVRMANRNRNRRKVFLSKVKSFLTH